MPVQMSRRSVQFFMKYNLFDDNIDITKLGRLDAGHSMRCITSPKLFIYVLHAMYIVNAIVH